MFINKLNNVRMLNKERYKPIGDVVEEGETLDWRESAIIDI